MPRSQQRSNVYGYTVECDKCHGKKFLADGASSVLPVLKFCGNISRGKMLRFKQLGDQLWERLPYIAAVLLLLFLAM